MDTGLRRAYRDSGGMPACRRPAPPSREPSLRARAPSPPASPVWRAPADARRGVARPRAVSLSPFLSLRSCEAEFGKDILMDGIDIRLAVDDVDFPATLAQELQLRQDVALVPGKPVADRLLGIIVTAARKKALDRGRFREFDGNDLE